MDIPSVPPVVLITGVGEPSFARVVAANGYAVAHPPTARLALERAREARPDLVIVGPELPDCSPIEACRLLHHDPHIGGSVPILMLSPDKPTPQQRVTALEAGAWDFVRYPGDLDELAIKLQSYVQAKRNIDAALADRPVDPPPGLHDRAGLARRARELGALMGRQRGALACVVVALETDRADPTAAGVVAQAVRASDVVGALGPTEFAVVAPATDDAGAVQLAQRIGAALRETFGEGALAGASELTLRAGYDAVGNLGYSPIDPVALLLRATTALRSGKPEPGCPWVRRFDTGTGTDRGGARTERTTPSGVASDSGRSSA